MRVCESLTLLENYTLSNGVGILPQTMLKAVLVIYQALNRRTGVQICLLQQEFLTSYNAGLAPGLVRFGRGSNGELKLFRSRLGYFGE